MENCSIDLFDSNEPKGELSLSIEGNFDLFLNARNIKDMSISKGENGYMIMSHLFVFFVSYETGDRLLQLIEKQKLKIDFIE